MNITFSVAGNEMSITKKSAITAHSVAYPELEFTFDEEWDSLSKVCVFRIRHTEEACPVPITDGRCIIPADYLSRRNVIDVGVYGAEFIPGTLEVKRQITTNYVMLPVREGAFDSATPEAPNPPASLWTEYLDTVRNIAAGAENSLAAVVQAKNETLTYKNETVLLHGETETFKNTASDAAQTAIREADRALNKANEAQASKADAQSARNEAIQALLDLLNMLGTDIATLTNGKLTPSQIPPLSINDVFEVYDTEELLSLNAERGDTALVLGSDGDGLPVVTDTYLLAADDPTQIQNWKKLGISSVAHAARATTADSAVNSDRINGKRMVAMTQSQYENAAIDDNTYYIVVPDEV